MSRSTQWIYNMVYFSTCFYSYEQKHRSKATAKKYTKAYHIICSLCRSTHLESNTIGFSILWFLCDLLWFFKTAFGGNLTGFGKFRGWYRPFYRLGDYVVHPHSWGGDIDFFQYLTYDGTADANFVPFSFSIKIFFGIKAFCLSYYNIFTMFSRLLFPFPSSLACNWIWDMKINIMYLSWLKCQYNSLVATHSCHELT